MNIFDVKYRNQKGSALIIVVVLVVMLAVVGFTFVMLSRLDTVGSESVSQVREMDGAAKYVIERIGEVIADDAQDNVYDYPDSSNRWLACIEPYYDAAQAYQDGAAADDYYKYYKWRQISNIFGGIWQNIDVDPSGNRQTIDEYQSSADVYNGALADADGDGVADSRWVRLDDVKTNTGGNYYAAVRIIDNSGMINVNTAYKDGRTDYKAADEYMFYGDSQLAVNLAGLLHSDDEIDDFFAARGPQSWSGTAADKWLEYQMNVIDRLSNPTKDKDYPIFGVSDELSLRSRFCINPGYNTRIEEELLNTLDGKWGSRNKPYMGGDYGKLVEWCLAITGDDTTVVSGATVSPADRPDRRHLLTTLSKSREMTPSEIKAADLTGSMEVLAGKRKAYINKVSQTPSVEGQTVAQLAGNIYYALKDNEPALKQRFGSESSAAKLAWHYALNLIDYQDNDAVPSFYQSGSEAYWGFEGIDALRDDSLVVSEICYFDNTESTKPFELAVKYYALELFNPSDNPKTITALDTYYITIGVQSPIDLYRDVFSLTDTIINGRQTIVITNYKTAAATIFGTSGVEYYEVPLLSFAKDDLIYVHKANWPVADADMPVDGCKVTLLTGVAPGSLQRAQRRDEITAGSGILLPDSWDGSRPVGLGQAPEIRNIVSLSADTANEPIYSIGEIGNVFAIGAYGDTLAGGQDECFASALQKAIDEAEFGINNPLKNWGRFDFTNAAAQSVFNYLTIYRTSFDDVDNDGSPMTSDKPMADGIDNDGDGVIDNAGEDDARYYETVVHGKININTAPRKAIEQLPWMTPQLASAVIARRDGDKLLDMNDPNNVLVNYNGKTRGYRNIAQVLEAGGASDVDYDIQQYGKDALELDDYPDFTDDDFKDDYEERDILFHRISNLITVKSDVFTAYIVIRAGRNGPQQRLTAIFDRSNVYDSGDKPEVIIQKTAQLGR